MEMLEPLLLAVIAVGIVVIALDVRTIRRHVAQAPDLPWLAPIRDGVVDGDVPKISDASTLLGKLEYAGCALSYLVQMQSQRNRGAGGGGRGEG